MPESVNRRIGLGVTLGVDASGGTSYTTLGAIIDGHKGPNTKAKTADVTIITDTFEQVAKGQIAPGEVTFTVAYDPDSTTNATLKTLHDTIQVTPPRWLVTLPSGTTGAGTITTKTFQGFVTGLSREMTKDKMLTQEVTVALTGDPGM